ncbi:MAG: chorismate mutase [Campylobacterales bacterium]|nr:chorismate mutase [Campylobacterales bacterium]
MSNQEEGLKNLRDQLDGIDDQILTLLNQRMEVVHQVGLLKAKSGGAIYRPAREKAIIERLHKQSVQTNGLLNKNAIEALFLEIFAISRNLELPEKVAFLGPLGTYTHQMAESRFGATSEYVAMNSINGVFQEVSSGRAKFGVIPIENSSSGIVNDTLMALNKYDLKIVANTPMRIHNTFSSNCKHISDIKKIYSKDVVFAQCRLFLSEHKLDNIELVPVESTAKAVQIAIKEPNSAAISSRIAASMYGLPVIYENIEDNGNNNTEFIIISDFENAPSGNDNTAILAKLSKQSGSLVRFLKDFDEANINLTKIESHIIQNELIFYIEFDGHKEDHNVKNILQKNENQIKFLGSYIKEGDDF